MHITQHERLVTQSNLQVIEILYWYIKGSQFKEIFRYIGDYSRESESILLR